MSRTTNLCTRALACFLALALALTGCGGSSSGASGRSSSSGSSSGSQTASESGPAREGNRPSDPVVLVPEASGTTVFEYDHASIDASNSGDGYIMVNYFGEAQKVKLQIQTPTEIKYTYTIHSGIDTFPLTGGSGTYEISVWEQRPAEGDYISAGSAAVEAAIENEFSPYLYPNQYVSFTADSQAVKKGAELVTGAADDLDALTRIYDYVTETIAYDDEKAQNVESGYVPNVDEVLETKKGICFDYASLMAAMLRSQQIPTRLEIGYAGTAYHAWISAHIDEIGWVNGIIEFDGSEWKIMDPTFAANSGSSSLKDFIGNGDNYQTKFIY